MTVVLLISSKGKMICKPFQVNSVEECTSGEELPIVNPEDVE